MTFRDDFADPRLTWATVDVHGTTTRAGTPIEVDGTYMIHDCATTDDHLVLFVRPLRFDLAVATSGGQVPAWSPTAARAS